MRLHHESSAVSLHKHSCYNISFGALRRVASANTVHESTLCVSPLFSSHGLFVGDNEVIPLLRICIRQRPPLMIASSICFRCAALDFEVPMVAPQLVQLLATSQYGVPFSSRSQGS